MKSRTLMEVDQSPVLKPRQQSPASASCLSAALVAMVRLRTGGCRKLLRCGSADRLRIRVAAWPGARTPASRLLSYVKEPQKRQRFECGAREGRETQTPPPM